MKLNLRHSYVCIGVWLVLLFSISYITNKVINNIDFDKMAFSFAKSKSTHMDYWKGTNRSLTVVTAFFDIGNFSKVIRYLDEYKKWREAYKYLRNPLVIYTDSIEFAQFFQTYRKKLSALTKVVFISRQELWAFRLLPKIAALYSRPDYPTHYPNKYVPTYTSITHSKLTFVVKAIKSNYFDSDYYCWVDMGYFRHIVGRQTDFYLEIPSDIDNSKIALTRVYESDLNQTSAKSILLQQRAWIAGGFLLGKPDVMIRFESQFKHRVKYYLSKGLMNNEEQIIYSMYTKQERKKNPITVELQLYIPGKKSVIVKNDWFYLGYIMYHEFPKCQNIG